MGRETGNNLVKGELLGALTNFLKDHREHAVMNDSKWLERFIDMSLDERGRTPGCGCEDCQIAERLRESMFCWW
jgi:hypothetical protein